MQQPPAMIPTVPSVSAATITTEQIQKYLDENKKLISAIMENQNLGKLAECAQYQALLQKNLMYLAAIADAQPQTSSAPPQVGSHPNISPGGFYMQQHPQSAPPIGQQQQAGVFHPRMPLHFNSPPYQSHEQHQQQQVMQGQMGHNQSGGLSNSGATPPPTVSTVQKERNAMELGSSNADGRGTLGGGGGGVRPRVSEG